MMYTLTTSSTHSTSASTPSHNPLLHPLLHQSDISASTSSPLPQNGPVISVSSPFPPPLQDASASASTSMSVDAPTTLPPPSSSPRSSPSKSRDPNSVGRTAPTFSIATSAPHLQSHSPHQRSPSTSPRRRRSTIGSKYSPPPALPVFDTKSPAVPGLPLTPPVPRSPLAGSTDGGTADYFATSTSSVSTRPVPSPKKKSALVTTTEPAALVISRPVTRTDEPSDIVVHLPPPKYAGHNDSASISSLATNQIKQRTVMAAMDSQTAAARKAYHKPGGPRSFSTDMRPSANTESSTRLSGGNDQQKDRDRERKAMLSKALQKAHQAVLLDNAGNFEGAVDSYGDACELLHQVLIRSTADEERKKLDQIRETYSNRIQELLQLNREAETNLGKSLPARPMSDESLASQDNFSGPSDDEVAIIETATATKIERSRSPSTKDVKADSTVISQEIVTSTLQLPNQSLPVPNNSYTSLTSPMDPSYVPPPLSPRRPPKEIFSTQSELNDLQDPESAMYPNTTTTWLSQAESISTSASSSVQSLVEGNSLHQQMISTIDNSQADFDAALDAAVEAAYDDGLEPFDYYEPTPGQTQPDQVTKSQQYNSKSSQLPNSYDENGVSRDTSNDQYLEGFDFGLPNKATAPRQSDSSAYSGSTWHSSISSTRATGSTSLTTVAEGPDTTLLSGGKVLGSLPRLSEENTQAESPNGSRPGSRGQQLGKSSSGSVRNRRLSGQNAKQLKIETQPITKATSVFSKNEPTIQEETSSLRSAGLSRPEAFRSDTTHNKQSSLPSNGPPQIPPLPVSAGSRPLLSPSDTAFTISPATPGLPPSINEESNSPGGHRIPSSRPTFLRKNKSSMSLKNRTVSSPDGSDGSVATPLSTTSLSRKFTNTTHPSLPTPTFLQTPLEGSHAGPHIFKTDFHSPHSPGFPNPLLQDGPAPLEPCPEAVLLRPFWLLRCIFQTIANPAGGYVSNRLFVTPQVWNTKGVKLKNIDDKVAACETLTTALLRLTNVDSYDASAVLDEMQSLETVLDSVQVTLTKKLGHDVGVSGTTSFLKDAPAETYVAAGNGVPASAGPDNPHGSVGGTTSSGRSSSKGYFSSLRKLRSKTSGSALVNGAGGGKDGTGKDGKGGAMADGPAPKMSSVPMTTLTSVRFTKRDISVLSEVTGPNATYMVSLARLCDAVQVVDQIARQVEDPGLRGSSPVHVGLDLSTRHASEFLGFYVCRWIMADLGTLLDKFVKRSTEWVLT